MTRKELKKLSDQGLCDAGGEAIALLETIAGEADRRAHKAKDEDLVIAVDLFGARVKQSHAAALAVCKIVDGVQVKFGK